MSEQQRQHFSALVDGETDPTLVHPTLSALESNERLIAAREDYHLIGAAIRSEQIRPEYRLIKARVSERIATEPSLRRPTARQRRALRLRPLAVCAGPGEQAEPISHESPGTIAGIPHAGLLALCDACGLCGTSLVFTR